MIKPLCLQKIQLMVLRAGLEPAHLSARDFKSLVSTYFTTGAFVLLCNYYSVFCYLCQYFLKTFLAPGLGIEPRLTESKSVVLPLHNPGTEIICYIVDFISLLFYNLTTQWQLYCRTARYHLRLRGVRNNKIKQDAYFSINS